MNITYKSRLLHAKLGITDNTVPGSRDFLELLTRISRDAATSARQSEESCSYEWADRPAYRKRMEQCDARLERHGRELAQLWPGARLSLDGDPRGYVVTVVTPSGREVGVA